MFRLSLSRPVQSSCTQLRHVPSRSSGAFTPTRQRPQSRHFSNPSTSPPRPNKMNRAFFFSLSSSFAPRSGLVASSFFRRAYSQGPGWSSRSANSALWTLFGLNAVVFGGWQYAERNRDARLSRWLHENTTVSWSNIHAHRYYTLITSAFSHQNTPHFIFNMITLHTFGSLLAMVPGFGGFHMFSLAIGCAIVSSGAWLYHQTNKADTRQVTRDGRVYNVQTIAAAQGASGIVMGASAVATCLMPFAPMGLLFIPFPMPLWLLSCGYVAIDLFYLDSTTSRVGHAAHLGGFLYGVAYYFANFRRTGGIWQIARRGLRR